MSEQVVKAETRTVERKVPPRPRLFVVVYPVFYGTDCVTWTTSTSSESFEACKTARCKELALPGAAIVEIPGEDEKGESVRAAAEAARDAHSKRIDA